MRLPLKTIMRKAQRPVEEPTGPAQCETCDGTYDHESWCPERMHQFLAEWRRQQQEKKP